MRYSAERLLLAEATRADSQCRWQCKQKMAVKIMGEMQQARVIYVGWLLVAGYLVGGCASLNESECRSADWRTIGYEDGALGESAARIGKHRQACASHGIAPNLAAYQQGREEGLRQFCRPQNGFRLGEQGVPYRGICPHTLNPNSTGPTRRASAFMTLLPVSTIPRNVSTIRSSSLQNWSTTDRRGNQSFSARG